MSNKKIQGRKTVLLRDVGKGNEDLTSKFGLDIRRKFFPMRMLRCWHMGEQDVFVHCWSRTSLFRSLLAAWQ